MPRPKRRVRIRDLDDFVARRRALGTQREVAPQCAISHQYLGELEAGTKGPILSRAYAVGIARGMGVAMEVLFEQVDQPAAAAVAAAERMVS